jgi:hypothetical protein
VSTISEIRDAIQAQAATTLGAGWRILPNPYVIDQNTYLQLQKGYAIRSDSGLNTERYITSQCLVTWERIFTIVLVRQMTATQNNVDARDAIDQALLDDIESLHKAFELNHSLGGKAIKCIPVSDIGINFIDAERLKFLSTEINLRVEYQFDPNT